MSTTAQKVFDKAMAIIDALDDSGASVNDDTLDYKNRAVAIINILQSELYRYSDSYTSAAGVRPIIGEIESLDDNLRIDDFLTRTIMPYGLTYHLLVPEDPAAAGVYLQRYQELIARYGGAVPGASEDIRDVYGGLGSWGDD